QGLTNSSEVSFEDGQAVDLGASYAHVCTAVNSGEPFRTSGCPGCNRPFYNESPRGPIYNYPKKLSPEEIDMVREQLGLPRPRIP
ncbi:MAG: radical SAM protein, partial [Candidatus Hadarchaeota archaeon]|nr:radical SAM protein [Candidatus Hadarchaeota archaeon]